MWLSSVFDGMTELCKTYFPKELKQAQQSLRNPMLPQPSTNRDGRRDIGQQGEEEDEEGEEER